MHGNTFLVGATVAVASLFLIGVPASVANSVQQGAVSAATRAGFHSKEAYMDLLTVGWEIWREAPSAHLGHTRFEVRKLHSRDLSDPSALSDPKPIGGAEMRIAGRILPFRWNGRVFVLDVADSLLAVQAGRVSVHEAGGSFSWSVRVR